MKPRSSISGALNIFLAAVGWMRGNKFVSFENGPVYNKFFSEKIFNKFYVIRHVICKKLKSC
jgi:hypothetical protein